MNYLERLQAEERAARREKLRESEFALRVARKIAGYTKQELQNASILAEHSGELGFVGRMAQAELNRRSPK